MIRDPSDGSVRAVHRATEPAATPIGQQKPAIDGPPSGLPFTSTKPENLARLEKSREWLKSYHGEKCVPNPTNGE